MESLEFGGEFFGTKHSLACFVAGGYTGICFSGALFLIHVGHAPAAVFADGER